MQERRTDNRLLCADLVEVIWVDPMGQERRKIGNLEDISLCGLCIQLEMPVRIGSRIRMLYRDGELSGTVRYSSYRDQACFIGVELDEESRWSVKQFVPEHLLDPRELVDNVMLRYADSPDSSAVH